MATSAKHKKRNDLLLILCLLVVAVLIWLAISLRTTDGAWVVVTRDGNEIARYELSEDTEVDINDEAGYNKLVIKDGIADVTDADCPDRLCVRQTAISKNGQSIVCLPHKLVISIEGGAADDLDAVAE
jgi:hypothetical protein